MKTCPACGHNNSDLAQHCAHCQSSLVPGSGAEKTRLVDPSEYTVEVGDVIDGRYKVVRLLGRGGMGEVYLVLDLLMDGEECALKLIHPELVHNLEAKQRFKIEVSTCRKLRHPSIIQVFDLNSYEDRYYFTMEFIAGNTLAQLVKKHAKENSPLALEDSRIVMKCLLEGLAYAHKLTIHRDIKSDNVMLSGDFPDVSVKILDFGIARTMSASHFTRTHQQFGTAYYMAPEQLHNVQNVDLRADLYGVGMILYELLTGKKAVGRFKLPSECLSTEYSPFDDILKIALAPDPEERFADAGCMLEQLEEAFSLVSENLAGKQEPDQNNQITAPQEAATSSGKTEKSEIQAAPLFVVVQT